MTCVNEQRKRTCISLRDLRSFCLAHFHIVQREALLQGQKLYFALSTALDILGQRTESSTQGTRWCSLLQQNSAVNPLQGQGTASELYGEQDIQVYIVLNRLLEVAEDSYSFKGGFNKCPTPAVV